MKLNKVFEDVKYFFRVDLKKFLWYLLTEPFRRIGDGIRVVGKNITVIRSIQGWLVIFALLTFITLAAGNVNASRAFAACFVMVVIHYEWKKGSFRKRWKDKQLDKAKKIYYGDEVKEDGCMENDNSGSSLDRRVDNLGNTRDLCAGEKAVKEEKGEVEIAKKEEE